MTSLACSLHPFEAAWVEALRWREAERETEIHEVIYLLGAVGLVAGSSALGTPMLAETTIRRRGRGRPRIEGERPWQTAGVSRATFYRRKADGSEGQP